MARAEHGGPGLAAALIRRRKTGARSSSPIASAVRPIAPLFLDVRRFMRAARLFRDAAEYINLAEFAEPDGAGRRGQGGDRRRHRRPRAPGRRRRCADLAHRRQWRASAKTRPRCPGSAPPRSPAPPGARRGRPPTPITATANMPRRPSSTAPRCRRAARTPISSTSGSAPRLALAGRRAEAETAFRAVTTGPRAELAQYWLLWLASRPAAAGGDGTSAGRRRRSAPENVPPVPLCDAAKKPLPRAVGRG